MQAAFGCCILLLWTCPQDGLDTVQLALVVFFLTALVHFLMRILQLALCGGGGEIIKKCGGECT